jgi:hypothetical protein
MYCSFCWLGKTFVFVKMKLFVDILGNTYHQHHFAMQEAIHDVGNPCG